MANGETDARREPSAADIRRRGDKLQVTLAKIELAMDGPARAQSINQTRPTSGHWSGSNRTLHPQTPARSNQNWTWRYPQMFAAALPLCGWSW